MKDRTAKPDKSTYLLRFQILHGDIKTQVFSVPIDVQINAFPNVLIQDGIEGIEVILDELIIDAIDNIGCAKDGFTGCPRYNRFNLDDLWRSGFGRPYLFSQSLGEIKVFDGFANRDEF